MLQTSSHTAFRTVILFGILGSYLFLHILENILLKLERRAKIHEIGKIKAVFGLGMTPIYGLKNGQIKPLPYMKKTRLIDEFRA